MSAPEAALATEPSPLPLVSVRVVKFTHMVMGPTCGMVLGDLGAEVIKGRTAHGRQHANSWSSNVAGFTRFFNPQQERALRWT